MPLGNRALSGPINIHCDHSDAMLARDSGAVQIFTENGQEAYDYTLMAVRLAEDQRVLLPVIVNLDGFTLTHSAEAVELLPDEVARAFVGHYRPLYPLLDTARPTTAGPFDMPDFYYEHKRQQDEAMRGVLEVFPEVQRAYAEATGRNYRGYYEATGSTMRTLPWSCWDRRPARLKSSSMRFGMKGNGWVCSSCGSSDPSRMPPWPKRCAASRPWP